MTKTELLRSMRDQNIIRLNPPGSHRAFFVDSNAMCGNPQLLSELAELYATAIIDATSDSRKMPVPVFIVSRGIKASVFMQWAFHHLALGGLNNISFSWFDFGKKVDRFSIEPYSHQPQEGDRVLLGLIEMSSGGYISDMHLRLRHTHKAQIIGAAALFNSDNATLDPFRIPHCISVFSRKEVIAVLEEVPVVTA